jgi:8-oxo-dGTP diphosphatase
MGKDIILTNSISPGRVEKFHLIARGLILDNGKVLLAHQKGADNTFLPGGHINIGESAAAALKRELKEELGFDVDTGDFLGCVEADYQEATTYNHEINLVFRAAIKNFEANSKLVSHEGHLEFLWSPVDGLVKLNLLPDPLQKLVGDYVSGQKTTWWASSLPR